MYRPGHLTKCTKGFSSRNCIQARSPLKGCASHTYKILSPRVVSPTPSPFAFALLRTPYQILPLPYPVTSTPELIAGHDVHPFYVFHTAIHRPVLSRPSQVLALSGPITRRKPHPKVYYLESFGH